MIIYLDTADTKAIAQYAPLGVIDGVTINPTLLSRVGNQPLKTVTEIIDLLPYGDIHVEVTEDEPEKVYTQAKALAALNDRVIVKIPAHKKYYPVIDRLTDEGIAINATLVGSPLQALLMAKLSVSFVSLVIGRVEDSACSGADLVESTVDLINSYDYDTQVLVASVRSVADVLASTAAQADAITMPPEVFEKLLHHPLTDVGLEQFMRDWQNSGAPRFPR